MTRRFDPLKTCLHLRAKEMFYEDPDPEEALEPADDEARPSGSPSDHLWCECTQTGRGPDDRLVGVEPCSLRTRKCFAGIHSLK